MNSKLRGVEDADLLLLIGTNPKTESPVFNARIRKAVVKNNLNVGLIGSPYQLGYDYDHVGTNVKSIIDILDGKHPFSAKIANVIIILIIRLNYL
jgi:NADH dehydrogenase (ubiquinone) Fe-S protein 1